MKSFYDTNVLGAIALKSKLVLVVIIGLGICLCVVQVETDETTMSLWRKVDIPDSAAYPLQAPVLVEEFVIWHSFNDSALNLFNLPNKTLIRHVWLHGTLVQWTARLYENQLYLFWRTTDDHLWTAVLNAEGQQLTAPISISGEKVTDFRVSRLKSGLIAVVWQTGRELHLSLIDSAGRPRPPVILLPESDEFAIHQDHVVWRSGNNLFMGLLHFDQPEARLTPELTIESFQLASDEMLANLQIFQTETNRIVTWGISSVIQPDIETYRGVLLPLEGLTEPVPFQISLPNNEPLRWATVSDSQLVTAAHINQKWQPIIINFGVTGAEGYQLIEGDEILASPPVVHDKHAGWVTIDDKGLPVLYMTTLDTRYTATQDDENALQDSIKHGLKKSYLGLAWLILPALGLYFLPQLEAVALASYWFSKAIFSFGMFDMPPTGILLLESHTASTTVALAMITMMAFTMSLGRFPSKIRWAIYFLTDALLTIAFFGAVA